MMRWMKRVLNIGRARRPGRLHGLLALNGALLLVLGAVTFGPSAEAQVRARGSYTMVAGGVNGSASGAVYIVDTTNEELIALTYDPNSKELVGVGFRSLAADVVNLGRPGQGR